MTKYDPRDRTQNRLDNLEHLTGELHEDGSCGAFAALALVCAIGLLSDSVHAVGKQITTAIQELRQDKKYRDQRDAATDMYKSEREKNARLEREVAGLPRII